VRLYLLEKRVSKTFQFEEQRCLANNVRTFDKLFLSFFGEKLLGNASAEIRINSRKLLIENLKTPCNFLILIIGHLS
jgi:hypothetical protein